MILIVFLFLSQIINGDYYFKRARNNYLRVIPLRAIRGTIYDRNGTLLARDKAAFNISVIPYQIRKKKDELFKELSLFLECDSELIAENYRRNLHNRFSPVNILKDVNKYTALFIMENFKNDVLINPQPQRHYVYPREFAHVIGYVQEAASFYEKLKKYGYTPLERAGFGGIEQYYDPYLKGEDGGDLVEVDAAEKIVGFLGEKLPQKGRDVYLTIDRQFQRKAYEVMTKRRGALILMDANSGEILALYSAPSFDPNKIVAGQDIEGIFRQESSPFLNRAIQAKYPIGSAVKPLLALGALMEKEISPAKSFACNGSISLGRAKFRCWSAHGIQNLRQALTHSCNVYFYNTALALGPDALSRWLKKFGLDSLTGIDLPYETKSFVPTVRWKKDTLKQNWFSGDTLNLSIGQGFMAVSPIAVTVALSSIANNGYLVKPYLLKKIEDRFAPASDRAYLNISEKNLESVRKGLRDVVASETGTAKLLAKLDLEISGKTGTAQATGKSHSWFVGFFPCRDSTYTICVFLEHGGSSYQAVRVTYDFLKRLKADNLL